MNFLDIILIFLGISAGIGSFITGSDSLFKLFFGLIIGFLTYLVLSYQIELASYIKPELLDSYQIFLSSHALIILSLGVFTILLLGIFFMIQTRLSMFIHEKSPSHILLGLLLPIFLVGIVANLSQGKILSQSPFWKKVFSFFSESLLFQTFEKLPWIIFLILGFLIFYKSLFLIIIAFGKWLWEEVFPELFRGWKNKKTKKGGHKESEDSHEEEDHSSHKNSHHEEHEEHHGGHH